MKRKGRGEVVTKMGKMKREPKDRENWGV